MASEAELDAILCLALDSVTWRLSGRIGSFSHDLKLQPVSLSVLCIQLRSLHCWGDIIRMGKAERRNELAVPCQLHRHSGIAGPRCQPSGQSSKIRESPQKRRYPHDTARISPWTESLATAFGMMHT